MDRLTFSESPAVTIATNTFIDVPTILQYEQTPLIQVISTQPAGYTTQIQIYHSDGTYLAKAVGSKLYLTKDGTKAGVTMEHPDKMDVCKLGDRVLFEMTREEAAALRTKAELHTPDGAFLKCHDSASPELWDSLGTLLPAGRLNMMYSVVKGSPIGILVRKDGAVSIGAKPPALHEG